MTTHPGHRHRRARHQRPGRTGSPRDRRGRGARGRGVDPWPGSGRPPRRRRPTSGVDVGGRAVVPGFVDSHSHLVFAGDRAAEFAARMAGESLRRRWHPDHGRRHPRRVPTSSSPVTSAASSPEMRAAGHHDGRDQERLRPHRPRRGAAACAVAGQFTEETTFLGAHVVPDGHHPRGVRRTGHRPDARGVRAARPVGRRVLRARGVRRRPGAGRPGRGSRGRTPLDDSTPTSSVPDPASGWPAELGLTAVDHCTYLTDADVAALARLRHRRDPAAGRRVLDPPALPRRPPTARRRRPRRAGHRLQPGIVLHQLHARSCIALAVREMGMTPAEAVYAATATAAGGPRP